MLLLRRAVFNATRIPRTLTRVTAIPILLRPSPVIIRTPRAAFSSAAGLSKEDIQARIVDVVSSFEKVSPEQVKTSSSFTDDLGLDSLDTVEVLMAVEEEFGIEIPDEEADEIKTVQQAIEYIARTPEAR